MSANNVPLRRLDVVASITCPNGQYRVEIVRRRDGLFEIWTANYSPPYDDGYYSGEGQWIGGPSTHGLYGSTELALQDALTMMPWLSDASSGDVTPRLNERT